MTAHWREFGLDLHIEELTYPGEHTNVAHGWDTARSELSDLLAAAGLPLLASDAHKSPPVWISYVRATRA